MNGKSFIKNNDVNVNSKVWENIPSICLYSCCEQLTSLLLFQIALALVNDRRLNTDRILASINNLPGVNWTIKAQCCPMMHPIASDDIFIK